MNLELLMQLSNLRKEQKEMNSRFEDQINSLMCESIKKRGKLVKRKKIGQESMGCEEKIVYTPTGNIKDEIECKAFHFGGHSFLQRPNENHLVEYTTLDHFHTDDGREDIEIFEIIREND